MTEASHTILSGPQAWSELSLSLRKIQPRKLLVVTGGESFALSGARDRLEPMVNEYQSISFSGLPVNARMEEIDRGVRCLREAGCDLVIGVGGGTVIDTAKAIALLATQSGEPVSYVTGENSCEPRQPGLIIIPTTAGTGSESTHFSVIYVDQMKHSLSHHSLRPDLALLDSTLTHSLSPYLTACTGLDALAQGVESLWSVRSTETSRELSRQVIRLALDNLEAAVNHPHPDNRQQMLTASNLAGQAINISRTTAAHATSYPFTAWFEVPHGHAVAVTLPSFIEYNAAVTEATLQDERGLEFVQERIAELLSLWNVSSPAAAKEKLTQLITAIGLPTQLSELGIDRGRLDDIVAYALGSARTSNNPRQLGADDLRALLERLW